MRIATSLVLVCAFGGVAAADNKVEVLDRGNAVEIIAHDVKAASTAIAPVRSRLEIPVVGTPTLNTTSSDKTVKVIETTGKGQKSISIKLGLERPEVAGLAKYAQAIQVGNDLHVIVPRALPAAGQIIDLPEPTLPPAMLAKAAAIAPIPTMTTEITNPEPIKPVESPKAATATAEPVIHAKPVDEAKPATAIVTKPEAKPDAKTDAKTEGKTEAKIAGATEPQQGRNFPIMIALVLAAVGCFAWMKRKHAKPAVAQGSSIEIVAQKSLGGKAKIVWLRAGGRDIMVSVTPGAVHTLGQWKKTGDAGAPVANLNIVKSGRIALPEATANEKPGTSTAVSGILKLRARTNVPFVNEEVATDDVDADAVWAREILAATTGARR